MYILDGNEFFIKLAGIFFITVGIVRIFLPNERKKELTNMNLSDNLNLDIIIILSEIIFGLILLFDLADKSKTILVLILFLIIGTILIIINNFNNIINDFYLVWTYQPTSMCLTLHLTYILLLTGIYLNLNPITI